MTKILILQNPGVHDLGDLTAEVSVYRDRVSVVGGINNLFDEDYYARIRGDGIDPAYGRNFYGGLQLSF